MYRLKVNNTYRNMLMQRDMEITESEIVADINENKTVCSGNVCGVIWKPAKDKYDRRDSAE